ncbi:hypothetical protein ACUY3M_00030 [Corynebacterium suicordis]
MIRELGVEVLVDPGCRMEDNGRAGIFNLSFRENELTRELMAVVRGDGELVHSAQGYIFISDATLK